MTPQLHPITGANRYCGPAAMATVLGISTDHAARLIRDFSAGKRVRAVYDTHLFKALVQAGCDVKYHRYEGMGLPLQTASEWVQNNRALFESSPVIIVFGRHYGTLLGAHYQCSLTRAKVTLQEIPQAHKKVECFFAIHGLPDEAPRDDVALERKHNARAFSKAQALARRFGIVIERPLRGADFSVYSPELVDDDPFEHLSPPTTGKEVLAMVKQYADYLQSGYLEAVTDPRLYCPAL